MPALNALNALAALLAAFLLLSAVAVASPSPVAASGDDEVTSVDGQAGALSAKPTRDGGSRDDEDLTGHP